MTAPTDIVPRNAKSFRTIQPGQLALMDSRGRSVSGWKAQLACWSAMKWTMIAVFLPAVAVGVTLEALGAPFLLQLVGIYAFTFGILRLLARPSRPLIKAQRA